MLISIYLADESIHAQVEDAVEAWLASAGLAVEERDPPVLGSWFRRLRAGLKRAVDSGLAEDVALTDQATDTRLSVYQDAQVTALLLQNLGPVITSLQPTKDAVIGAGALLIVKVDWQVRVFQLTAAQQAKLNQQPHLAWSPREIVAALRLTSSEAQEGLPVIE
jgi:hypothetical protein